jgi:predicted acylesterase/phospholipase RssA
MTIRHLVLTGGGGHAVLRSLGAYQQLEKDNFLNIKNIETIWGTSAGTIVGTFICLNMDWEVINSYLIERPWHEVFAININNLIDLYNKKGLYDIDLIKKMFKPLFALKDLSVDITLNEFFEYSNIELHFSTFEINNFELMDISYKTHADLSLLTAIQMSCGLPVIFSPVCIDDKIYIDGGIKSSYSLNECIKNKYSIDEIMGFKNQYNDSKINIPPDSNFIDYIITFIFKIIRSMGNTESPYIKHELGFPAFCLTFDMLKDCSESKELRESLLLQGTEIGANYFKTVLKN